MQQSHLLDGLNALDHLSRHGAPTMGERTLSMLCRPCAEGEEARLTGSIAEVGARVATFQEPSSSRVESNANAELGCRGARRGSDGVEFVNGTSVGSAKGSVGGAKGFPTPCAHEARQLTRRQWKRASSWAKFGPSKPLAAATGCCIVARGCSSLLCEERFCAESSRVQPLSVRRKFGMSENRKSRRAGREAAKHGSGRSPQLAAGGLLKTDSSATHFSAASPMGNQSASHLVAARNSQSIELVQSTPASEHFYV